jgi:hypothetical protein
MAVPPQSTPAPVPIFVQGTTPADAAPADSSPPDSPAADGTATPSESIKSKQSKFDLPKFRLKVNDLSHEGSDRFFAAVNASRCMEESVTNVLKWLYESPESPKTTVPSTRSVTLILRDMGGVAYTTGSDLDDDHKEIHFSLSYIASIDKKRIANEICGVITHELVHCYQYNGFGSCPGGLIEGIADWVRLNCNLGPPHWKREATGDWDAGYQHTGYFLEYLEKRFGTGTVRRINEKLRTQRYQQKKFWTELLGRPVEQLWGDYQRAMEEGE